MSTHTVKFSKIAYWTSGAGILGVSFVNVTNPSNVAVVNSVAELSGASDLLTYTVTWDSEPQFLDTIQFVYDDATGVYTDEEGNALKSQTVTLTNCAAQDPYTFTPLPDATFAVDLAQTLTPVLDAGNGYTYSRGEAGGTITDWEPLVKDVGDDQVMIDGAREVVNRVSASDDLTQWELINGATVTKNQVTYAAANQSVFNVIYADAISFTGTDITISFDAQHVSGNAEFRVDVRSGAGTGTSTAVVITTTSTRKRYSVTFSPASGANPGLSAAFRSNAAGEASVINMWDIQVEDVTGQDNQNPSDYVSVGVGTGDELASGNAATSDDVDAITGWTAANGATLVSTSEDSNGTIYSIKINATGTNGGKAYLSLEALCTVGKMYELRFDAKSIAGAGNGAWQIGTSDTSAPIDNIIRTLGNGDGWETSTYSFTYSIAHRWFVASEVNAENDGGVYIDNFSVKEIDHGTNVDGAKYFTTTNGNTVLDNVVQEAPGVPIPNSIVKGTGIWEARTNTQHFSEDFASWSVGGSFSFGADGVAPNGETDADYATSTGTGSTLFEGGESFTAGQTMNASVFVKYIDHQWIRLTLNQVGGFEEWFDIQTAGGVVGGNGRNIGTGGSFISAGIEAIGNGWLRIWITGILNAADTTANIAIRMADGNGSNATVNGASAYLWGADRNIGAFITPYIPSTGAASSVTRPDTLLEYGVENYSATGSMLIEFYLPTNPTGAARMLFVALDESLPTTTYMRVFINSSGAPVFWIRDATGGVFLNMEDSGVLSTGPHKIALTWSPSSGTSTFFIDGVERDTLTADSGMTDTSPIDKLYIGRRETGIYLNGNIVNIHKWNTQLSDALLAEYSTL